MLADAGNRPRERRLGGKTDRQTIRFNHPETKKTLAGIDLSSADVASVTAFANKMNCALDAWRRRIVPAERGRIDRRQAERLLHVGFAMMAKGGDA